jgi:hypothetical protein
VHSSAALEGQRKEVGVSIGDLSPRQVIRLLTVPPQGDTWCMMYAMCALWPLLNEEGKMAWSAWFMSDDQTKSDVKFTPSQRREWVQAALKE